MGQLKSFPFRPIAGRSARPIQAMPRRQPAGHASAAGVEGSPNRAHASEGEVVLNQALAEATGAEVTAVVRDTCGPEVTSTSSTGSGADMPWMCGIAILAWFAFLPVLNNGWVDWDDDSNIFLNSELRGLGWTGLKWAWTTDLLGVYQPIAWMLFEAEYAIGGLSPLIYHGTSMLLHVANAVILFILVRSLISRSHGEPAAESWEARASAALAVAFFAVHPLRVEVVAWASCQPYLLCAFFVMSAVLAYLRAYVPGEPTRRRWLAVSLAASAAAMLSKAPAIILPAVFVILDVYPLRRLGGGRGRWFSREARRVWLEKIPFFALALISGVIAVRARMAALSFEWGPVIGLGRRLVVATHAVGFYLVKTLLPFGLSTTYSPPTDPTTLILTFLLLAGITMAALVLLRSRPAVLAAWAVYLMALVPNVGLMLLSRQSEADRSSYIPAIAFAPLLAAAFCQLGRWKGERAMVPSMVLAVAMLVALIPITWRQCGTWSSTVALWSQVVEFGGADSIESHRLLGDALAKAGRTDEAIRNFWRAESLAKKYGAQHPHEPWAESVLGQVLDSLGIALVAADRPALALPTYQRAIEHQSAALRRDPGRRSYRVMLSYHYSNLGVLQMKLGKADSALDSFNQARDLLTELARETPGREDLQKQMRQTQDLLQSLSRGVESTRSPRNLGAALP